MSAQQVFDEVGMIAIGLLPSALGCREGCSLGTDAALWLRCESLLVLVTLNLNLNTSRSNYEHVAFYNRWKLEDPLLRTIPSSIFASAEGSNSA